MKRKKNNITFKTYKQTMLQKMMKKFIINYD